MDESFSFIIITVYPHDMSNNNYEEWVEDILYYLLTSTVSTSPFLNRRFIRDGNNNKSSKK